MRIIQGILSRILFILGVIVYLSTVSIAFVSKGLVVGVLSASLPILSNIYWVQNLKKEIKNKKKIKNNTRQLVKDKAQRNHLIILEN
jgi:hypothetical protein